METSSVSRAPSRTSSFDTFESVCSNNSSAGRRSASVHKPHAHEAAQDLVRHIVGDETERISKASCFRALKMCKSEREAHSRAVLKLEKVKKQRDDMSIPLRRLTGELQKAKLDRKSATKLQKEQTLEIEALYTKVEELQGVIEFLEEEVRVTGEAKSKVEAKLDEMEKNFEHAGDTFNQILEVKGVEMSTSNARCDQQAIEIEEMIGVMNELNAQHEGLQAGLAKAAVLELFHTQKVQELELALTTCDAELTQSEARFKTFGHEVEESLAQAHCVADELEHELTTCQAQLDSQIHQIHQLEEELEETRLQGPSFLVAAGVTDGPIETPQEALGPLLRETERKLENREENVAELRQELERTTRELEGKDEKLLLLEQYLLEHTLATEEERKAKDESIVVEKAEELSLQLAESQRKVHELTAQLQQVQKEQEESKQREESRSLETEVQVGASAQQAAGEDDTVSKRYFAGFSREDLALRLAKGLHSVMNTSVSNALNLSNSDDEEDGVPVNDTTMANTTTEADSESSPTVGGAAVIVEDQSEGEHAPQVEDIAGEQGTDHSMVADRSERSDAAEVEVARPLYKDDATNEGIGSMLVTDDYENSDCEEEVYEAEEVVSGKDVHPTDAKMDITMMTDDDVDSDTWEEEVTDEDDVVVVTDEDDSREEEIVEEEYSEEEIVDEDYEDDQYYEEEEEVSLAFDDVHCTPPVKKDIKKRVAV